ncbi:hypothetical protein IE81DRAFT_348764 [Ceraceosorus guamensis]|uniref:BZIP domain-containing protein n=1 Tax=Ceraceosorus guamensis TaxID=1522189 RepID=A0A316VVK8_9BASI|nr:hypothetical protein IE81DRAFT_348764 [Ceraceosorus guamensis]PWN40978.1 hypothetical protein IE81DRAFT_348764 [Ceraceosorus guamensis]
MSLLNMASIDTGDLDDFLHTEQMMESDATDLNGNVNTITPPSEYKRSDSGTQAKRKSKPAQLAISAVPNHLQSGAHHSNGRMTGSPALLPASPSTADVCFPTHISTPSSHSASLHSLSFEFGESGPETSPDTGMSMVQSPSAALSLALPSPNPHSYTFDKPPFRSFGIQSPVAWPADGFGGMEHDARFVPDHFAMRLSHVDAYPAGPFRDMDGAEEMLTMPNAPVGFKMEASEHPMDFTLENMPSPFSEDRSSPSSSAHASMLGNVSPVSDKRRRLGSPTGSASTASSKVAHRSSDSKRRSGGGAKRKQTKKGASPPLPTSGADVPAETDPPNGEAQTSEATALPAQPALPALPALPTQPAQPAAVDPSLATDKQPEEAKLAPAKPSKKREPPSASQITESGQPFPVIDTSATHSSLFVHPDTSGLTKREARLVKNRAAAFLSRQRKREQFEELESRCRSMSRLVWRLWEVAAGPDMPWSAFGQTVLPMLLGEETPDVREVLELVVNAKGASIAPTEDPSAGSSVPPLSDQASEISESFSTRGVKRDRGEANHTANAATSDQAPQNELFSLRSQMEASNLDEAASASQWPASMNMLNGGSAAPRPQTGGSTAQAGDERPFRSGPPASVTDSDTLASARTLVVEPEAATCNQLKQATQSLTPPECGQEDQEALTAFVSREPASASQEAAEDYQDARETMDGTDSVTTIAHKSHPKPVRAPAVKSGSAGQYTPRKTTGGVALMVMLFSFALFGATSAPGDGSAHACGDNFFNLGQQIDSAGAPLVHCVLPKRKDEEKDDQEADSGHAAEDKSSAKASQSQSSAELERLLDLPLDLRWVRDNAPNDSMSMHALGEHLGRSGLDVERAYLDVDVEKESEQSAKSSPAPATPVREAASDVKPSSSASRRVTLFIPAPRTASQRAQQQWRASASGGSISKSAPSKARNSSKSLSFVKAARTAFRLLGATGSPRTQNGDLVQQDFFALELGLTGPKDLRSSAAIVEQLLAGARSVHHA